MSNDLLIGDLFDLLPDDPMSTDGPYQLRWDTSLSRGFGSPDTETVRKILDGERLIGTHTTNRSITLPILVIATSRPELTLLTDQLLQVIAEDVFNLEWTPDGGLPVVYECSRGTAEIVWNIAQDDRLTRMVTLTFQAAPYGRSRDPQYIAVDAGALAQLPVDSMDAGPWESAFVVADTAHWEGTHAAKTPGSKIPAGSTVSTQTDWYGFEPVRRPVPGGPVDLTGYGSIGVRFRWPAPVGTWTVTVLIQLFDTGVSVGGGVKTITVPAGDARWRLIRVPIGEDWLVDSVDEVLCSVVEVRPLKRRASRPAISYAWFDDLRAYPPISTDVNTTSEGAMLTVPGVFGSARSPVNVEITAATPITGICLHRPPGDQDPDLTVLLSCSNSSNPVMTVAADNARYNGTYAVVMLANNIGSAGTITLQAEQFVNGVSVGTAVTRPRAYTSADFDGKFLVVGNITLPPWRVPAECTTSSVVFTVTTTSGGTASVWADMMLLDTFGQTILCGALPTGTTAFYVDVDDVTEASLPYASTSDRSAAFSVMDRTDITGGPLAFDPGDNRLLQVCPEGVQDVAVHYFPHWLDERVA